MKKQVQLRCLVCLKAIKPGEKIRSSGNAEYRVFQHQRCVDKKSRGV